MGYGNIEISRQSASALRVLKPDSERKTKTEKKQKKDLCSELDCSSQPVPEIRQKTRRVPEGGIQLTRVRTGTRNVFSLKGNQTNQTSRALSNRNRIFFLIDIHTASGLYSAQVQCCFSSTKTVGTIRDNPGQPPRLSHSSWALFGSSSVLLYVHRDHKDYLEAQDGHFDFHTAPELCHSRKTAHPAAREPSYISLTT